jgi:hypothetical protein
MLPSPAPLSHDSAALRFDLKPKNDFLGQRARAALHEREPLPPDYLADAARLKQTEARATNDVNESGTTCQPGSLRRSCKTSLDLLHFRQDRLYRIGFMRNRLSQAPESNKPCDER